MTNPESQTRSEEMQAKALRLAMDYAIIALNGMNFDTSLASVKTEDIPRIASYICANGRGRLSALLTAEMEQRVKGCWECPKCGFVLQKNTLHTVDGNISADDSPLNEKCPNDGKLMKPLTLKHAYDNLEKCCQSQVERAVKAESERDELREVFDAAAKERHGASGMCCQLRDHVVKERDQLRAELASLRSNIGVLYEWLQGNTSLTGKQKEAANCIFEQLDKGVKEDSDLRVELATEKKRADARVLEQMNCVAAMRGELSTAKVEIEKWKLGCETNADCYKAAVREQDNQRLELLKAKAENAALRDVARAADQVRILLGPPNLATGLKPLADALRALAEKGVVLDERKD